MYRKEYYLIFSNTKNHLSRFLRYGFTHIKILHKDEFNWTLIEPTTSCLSLNILPYEVDDPIWKRYIKDGSKVIKIVMGRPYLRQRVWSICFVSCVQVSLYVLGLDIMALTPYGLYKKLCRMKDLKRYKIIEKKILY